MVDIVIGTQWGDEGKGKIVDLKAASADYVVRFHGGNNAGHTVVINGKKHFFHLIPSGVFQGKTIGVIANGVIVDLEVLVQEIEILQQEGINIQSKLIISPRCHLILCYHKELDQAYENARGDRALGTTKRGIGPCYADKVSYNGLRIQDLLNWELFQEKFTFQSQIKNEILQTFNVAPLDIKKELEKLKKLRSLIKPYVHDTFALLHDALHQDKQILLEGAHGVMLDNDWSPYPYCTASTVVVGGINSGAGIPIQKVTTVTGVLKSFTSRVGDGPLPTELPEKQANIIRKKGNEYGTTTGRPRRIGWLDLEAVTFACQINGITELAITKLDILHVLPELYICTGYKLQNKPVTYTACGATELALVSPVYKKFPGWKEDISAISSYKGLPAECKNYISFIETFLQTPIRIVSVGADRRATIQR